MRKVWWELDSIWQWLKYFASISTAQHRSLTSCRSIVHISLTKLKIKIPFKCTIAMWCLKSLKPSPLEKSQCDSRDLYPGSSNDNLYSLDLKLFMLLPLIQYKRHACCLKKTLSINLINKIWITCHKNYIIKNLFWKWIQLYGFCDI
jgi:hypothetical protein